MKSVRAAGREQAAAAIAGDAQPAALEDARRLRDAEPVIAERVSDIEHLLERGDAAAIGRIHRVHRLERKRHVAPACMG